MMNYLCVVCRLGREEEREREGRKKGGGKGERKGEGREKERGVILFEQTLLGLSLISLPFFPIHQELNL